MNLKNYCTILYIIYFLQLQMLFAFNFIINYNRDKYRTVVTEQIMDD